MTTFPVPRKPPDPRDCDAVRHGDYNAYHHGGCRCPEAREAWRVYNKRLREGRLEPSVVSSLGTARRLQALAAIGWPRLEIAARLGYGKHMVGHLERPLRTHVNVRTAAKVAAVYDELQDISGPCDRTRLKASALGYWLPSAWVDIDDPADDPGSVDEEFDVVAVERACRLGVERVELAAVDYQEVKRRLLESPLPAHEVACLLSVNVRTVDRWRASARPSREAA